MIDKTREERIAEWETTYLIGSMWCCDDEACNCHQPIIELVTPNRKEGFPYTKRDRVWEGTSKSDPDYSELCSLWWELREACYRRGVPCLEWTPPYGNDLEGKCPRCGFVMIHINGSVVCMVGCGLSID